MSSICGSICSIKEGVERKRTDSSINFSEAATHKSFSWHFPECNTVMLQRGVYWEQVIPNPEQPYLSPCLICNDILKEVSLKATCLRQMQSCPRRPRLLEFRVGGRLWWQSNECVGKKHQPCCWQQSLALIFTPHWFSWKPVRTKIDWFMDITYS